MADAVLTKGGGQAGPFLALFKREIVAQITDLPPDQQQAFYTGLSSWCTEQQDQVGSGQLLTQEVGGTYGSGKTATQFADSSP